MFIDIYKEIKSSKCILDLIFKAVVAQSGNSDYSANLFSLNWRKLKARVTRDLVLVCRKNNVPRSKSALQG